MGYSLSKRETNNNYNNNYENDFEFEYLEGNKYVGFGIKRMKAYKCDLNMTELQKKRDLFWKLKTSYNNENYIIWSIIQEAISLDDPRNIHYLKHFKIELMNGCINECKDKYGNIYKVPNYCINDPYFERKLNDNDNKTIKNELIDVKFYRYGNFEPFSLKISNILTGKEIKELYRRYENLDKNMIIRIFICGIEIKDNQYLYQHNYSQDKPIYVTIS